MERLRIFVSSPGDVGPERAVAAAVIERLQLEFRGVVVLETYLWERSLLRATETFQTQILDIREADLAVFILWSRIGTALPEELRRADGSRYDSGTEYEFEHARAGYDDSGRPELIFYLKTADVQLSVRDRDRREQQTAELDAVNRFVDRWFRNADGSFRSAYREFDQTAGFEEQFEHHLRDWVRRRVRGITPAEDQQWTGSPFRGLQPFDFEHALIYCGRTGLIAAVIDTLRQRADSGRGFLMIIGMSGAGKSSLVRAGVLPMLARPRVVERVIAWRRAVFRPSDSQQDLWASLAAALTAETALPEIAEDERPLASVLRQPAALVASVSRALDKATETARRQVPEEARHGRERLIVVVDQFEEIFDEALGAEERSRFAEVLSALVHSRDVWVLVTLRADMYARCAELPESFRDLVVERGGTFTVGGPRAPEIAQMIRQPAAMAGLSFERRGDPEEGLDEVLRDAAAEHPSVLPLLEFTLDELWKRSGATGVLRFSDYDELGGLQGALRRRADEEFARLPAAARDALNQVLSAIVRIDPTDERLIVESRVSRAQFGEATPAQTLIAAFIAAHLLVADRAPDGTPVIGLAHEALLREWPPAVEWVEQNRERLRLRAGIAAAAALWRDSRYDETRLLSGTMLRDAGELLAEAPHILRREEREFVEQSRERDRRVRRRQLIRVSSIVLAVAIAVLLPTIGLSQLLYASSVSRALWTVWGSDAPIPVSERARANLQGNLTDLPAYLESRLDEMGAHPEFNTWSVAQTWVALHGLDPSLPPNAAKLRDFMTGQRDPSCYCWRETEDKLPHTVATAWVLYALALYDQPAALEEIASLLDRQGETGWWSMFPATPDPGNASTAATAWASLALHAQLSHGLIASEQRGRAEAAIAKSAAWLRSRAEPGRARWSEYALDHTSEQQGDYLAVSALAVHALHRIADDHGFDELWLAELPRRVPTLNESESAKGYVFRSKNQFTLDDVRHYRYPWMLATTVEAFGAGSNLEKSRALIWIEEALPRRLSNADFRSEIWTIAEAVFAYRRIAQPLGVRPQPH